MARRTKPQKFNEEDEQCIAESLNRQPSNKFLTLTPQKIELKFKNKNQEIFADHIKNQQILE